MKKLIALLLIAPLCVASGPKYNFTDPHLNDELLNIYKDIGTDQRSTKHQASVIFSQKGPVTTTSTSFTATGWAATITPTSVRSQVKISVFGTCQSSSAGGASYYSIAKGGSELTGFDGFAWSNTGVAAAGVPLAMSFIDSPSTTTATTYTVVYKVAGAGNAQFGGSNIYSVMILDELIP